jgi:hypothetical protein
MALPAVVFSLVTAALVPAQAVISEYARKDFPVGQGLRSWGYLHDHCLALAVVCNVGGGADGVLRPEATAQSIAMWVLAALRLDLPLGISNKGFNTVDWEVGPRRPPPNPPDTPLATNPDEPPGEPADLCDPDAPGGSEPGDKWRIDIVVDRARHIEVKNFADAGKVDNQLNCYVARAAESGFAIDSRDGQLNTLLFAVPFVDNTGVVWCTWAPPLPLAGRVYFATMAATPADAAARCGGAALAAAVVVQTMKDKVKDLIHRERPEVNVDDYLKDKIRPAVIPSYRKIPRLSSTTYLVSAPQRPDRSMDLRFDFGDGNISTQTIPAGTGVVNLSFPKTFLNVGRFMQLASIVDRTTAPTQSPAVATSSATLEFEAATDVEATC